MFSRSSTLRFFFGLGLGLTIIVLTVFNTLLIWVATGPRVLDNITPYIERALSSEDGSYRVEVGQTVLLWDGWRNPVDIRLREVKLYANRENVFSKFPEVSMGVDVPSIFIGRLRPTRLIINKPVISLLQHYDYSIGIGYRAIEPSTEKGLETKEDVTPADIVLAAFSGKNRYLKKLEIVNIVRGHFTIKNTVGNVFFEATDSQLQFRKNPKGHISINATSNVRYGKNSAKLTASSSLEKNGELVRGGIQFNKIIPAEIEKLFVGTNTLKKLNMPASGGIQFKYHPQKHLAEELGFQLTMGQAEINHEMLEGTLRFDKLETRGKLINNLSVLQIDQLNADLDGIKLNAQGEVALKEPFYIKGDASIEHADAKDVTLLWPPSLSPISREWVTGSIKPAAVPVAKVSVDIKPGDLEKPVLPREAITAQIRMEKGTIKYLPEHPPVSNLSAIVNIDAVGLKADISQADYMNNTRLTDGVVAINDLNADNPRIEVSFKAEGPASDAVKILRLPRLKHSDRLRLKDTMKGNINANVSVAFDFFAPRNEDGSLAEDDNVNYDVQAELKDISQTGVLNKFDLQNCYGDMHVEEGRLTFSGGGTVNGALVEHTDIKYLFSPEEGLDTFVTVRGDVPTTALAHLGYKNLDFLKGTIGVNAELEMGPSKQQATAQIDLTKTDISENPLSWVKPASKQASLDVQLFRNEEKLSIPSFRLKGAGANLSGIAHLSKDLMRLESLELKESTLGENNIQSLTYEQKENSIRLEVKAKTLDLSHYLNNNKKGDGFSFQNFPAVKLDADVATFVLEKGHPIKHFKGTMFCTAMTCESANVTGKTADAPFQFKILKNPNGKRQLSFHGNNAGLFLKAMGIYDGMEAGLMTVSGNFDDEGKTSSSFKGRLVIGNFTLKDAPVLAKILTLASFTGFIDTMQGNGIAFKQLSAPFTLRGDVLEFKKAKAAGSALGITADGTITMPHVILDLSGTVVPSYTLNSGVGKVPLLGPLLTGGENSGVFAARYSVKGGYEDPKVGVNPLSMLTPGFLRNLFDIFDEKKEKNN